MSKSEVVGDAGTRRTATWVLKIPSVKFRETLSALAALGTPIRNSSDSEDVTEEFYDLQARVKNLKAEEDALNKMLSGSNDLESILKLRREITELRGNIEKAEGRLKYLSALTAMSTITLSVSEDAAYVPPTTPEPPTFRSRVTDTFADSFGMLRNFGEQIGLVLVALALWSPLILIGLLVLRWLVRIERRTRLERKAREITARETARETTPRRWRYRQTLASSDLPVADPVPEPPTGNDEPRSERTESE